jgi:hypothetical protein
MAAAQFARDDYINQLLTQANQWLAVEAQAQQCPGTPSSGYSLDSRPGRGSAACPSALKAIKLSMKIEFAKLAATCEKFEVELATPGPIGLFAQGSINTKGEITIFIGGKAGVEIPDPFKGGPSLASKTGAYVKIGPDGSITDYGWRVSPSVSVGSFSGAQSIVASDSMDFSLAGGF